MNRFEKIISILKEREMTITFAESCTGGLLAKTFTDTPGVSSVFLGSVVTYANRIKSELIDVKEKTLERHGAVSRETAYEMVKGAKSVFGADVAVSVTGIAGPDGGSEEKPVGLVYISASFGEKTVVTKNIFRGTREEVREAAAKKAIETAIEIIKENI